MKDIKFRAWLVTREKGYMAVDGMEFFPNGIAVWKKLDRDLQFLPGEAEIEQFTGLKDKNGREIYEGDIVRCVKSIGVIEYTEDRFFIKWISHSFMSDKLSVHVKYDIEVIGNIHENPELLK